MIVDFIIFSPRRDWRLELLSTGATLSRNPVHETKPWTARNHFGEPTKPA
jgi:hypothetical protein